MKSNMRIHRTNITDCKCMGCLHEIEECYRHQLAGFDAGLEFENGHIFMFSIDPKNGKFIVPYYNLNLICQIKESLNDTKKGKAKMLEL